MTRVRVAVQRLRFRLWAVALRARLRRLGVALVLDAPHGARFHALPDVELEPLPAGGRRGGTLTIRLGRDVKLGRGLTLDVWTNADSVLEVGDRTTFQTRCRVQLHGGAVRLANDVHVRDFAQLKARGELTVGERTVLSRDVIVHATAAVAIGAHCGIGERTSLIDSDHTVDGTAEPFLDRPLKVEPIEVGRNVSVSANAVLLRGTRVGDNALVAAGAVLAGGEFPGGWLVAGVPAKAIRALQAAVE